MTEKASSWARGFDLIKAREMRCLWTRDATVTGRLELTAFACLNLGSDGILASSITQWTLSFSIVKLDKVHATNSQPAKLSQRSAQAPAPTPHHRTQRPPSSAPSRHPKQAAVTEQEQSQGYHSILHVSSTTTKPALYLHARGSTVSNHPYPNHATCQANPHAR